MQSTVIVKRGFRNGVPITVLYKVAISGRIVVSIHQSRIWTSQLNGVNTQGENIADNGGIKEAYLAYNSWVKRNGGEHTLPGLNYSPNQMFWISAANTWCAKYRPESLKLRVLTGYHSPGYFRVIGPFSNLEYFAKDFNCPMGSKMNPKSKCKVW